MRIFLHSNTSADRGKVNKSYRLHRRLIYSIINQAVWEEEKRKIFHYKYKYNKKQ